jgi:hypothetical protein
MFRINVSACAFFLIVSCILPTVAQPAPASANASQSSTVVTIAACVINTTGAVRIVSNTTVCKSTEHKIQWNQTGPRGPQGNQGPQGVQGPGGPTGPQGPAGISVGYSANGSAASMTSFPGVLIAQTAPVVAGTYFVSASTLLVVDSGPVFCYSTTANNQNNTHNFGGSGLAGSFQQASNTDVWSVLAGDAIQLWCYDDGQNSSVFGGTITATLINTEASAQKARVLRTHP